MRTVIDSELMYGLLLKEEAEILSGDGTGQHLNGLITQATAYNTGLNVGSDQRLDQLRHASFKRVSRDWAPSPRMASAAPDRHAKN